MPAERVVRYADSGGVQIAYEVIGGGPLDIVVITDSGSNIDLLRENVFVVRFLVELGELARVIYIDPRGVGLSDPLDRLPPLEEWVDDVRAVLDEVGSEGAALVGQGYGAQLCLLFAAVHPDRTLAVVSINGYARLRRAPDYPAGLPESVENAVLDSIDAEWGRGLVLAATNREPHGRPVLPLELWARIERASGTPRRVRFRQLFAFEIDIRDVLPAIAVPTLVVQSVDDTYIRSGHAVYLVDNITGARLVEVPGGHMPFMTEVVDDLIAAVGGFVVGTSYARPSDRALMTVAFTDIVDSTRRAVEIGDRRWRAMLEHHDEVSRHEVERARGRVVKFTGDGMMATFDGPARAVQCVRRISQLLEISGLPIRAGVHTGEVEVRADDIGGIGVHIAARVSSRATAGETLVSSTVRDLVVGSGLSFEDRGDHELKGVPDHWRLFAVVDDRG